MADETRTAWRAYLVVDDSGAPSQDWAPSFRSVPARLIFRGGAVRSGAREVKSALGERFKPVPWVQAVIVVWGKFPQVRHEEQNVVYVHGTELAKWLNQLPERLSAPQRAAITEALRQVRKEPRKS